MYLLVLLLPLLNFITIILFGRFLSWKILVMFIYIYIILLFYISYFIFLEVFFYESICIVELSDWINIYNFKITWSFLFDSLTVIMIILVIFISACVHIYSVEYMSSDPYKLRFIAYLSLFTFFMLLLITSGNYLQLFFGWEGVGLSSYLLINFWFTRMQANKSAMKAMIINRVGDFGLYFSLFLLYYYFNSLDFSVIASYCVNNNYTLSFFVLHKSIIISNIDIICLFLLLGVVGKSAQIGLHMWLPDAMEGPTPVSALIHAATMVTAGVFLLIRSSFLFEKSSLILFLVTFLGLITVLLSGIIGIFQNDIKKIIAYSTCSQLGYMILSCGLSNYSLALYHLFNHGFFKALLFLCSGSIIHALFDEQDMRKMGNLYRQLPLTFVTFITAILALLGLPFFTGFYSKDFIIETTAINYTIIPNRFFFWLNIFTLILTCLYSIKVLYMVFFGEIKLYNRLKVHENSYWISGVLIFLTLVSLIVGFLTQEFFLGFGNNYWKNCIFNNNEDDYNTDFLSISYKILPLIICILFSCILLIKFKNSETVLFILSKFLIFKNKFFFFFDAKLYFDIFFSYSLVKKFCKIFFLDIFKIIDRGFIDFFGFMNTVKFVTRISLLVHKFQTGYIYHYLFIFIISLIFIVFNIFNLNWFLIILALASYLVNLDNWNNMIYNYVLLKFVRLCGSFIRGICLLLFFIYLQFRYLFFDIYRCIYDELRRLLIK